jgi:hypothetical protein
LATTIRSDVEVPVRPPDPIRGLVALFAAVGFLGALLLFTVEPLAAKALLPVLGGSPSVWNTAMAFFQVSLLAGYVTAHLTSSHLRTRWRLPVQLLILTLPLLTLPFDLPDSRPASTSPIWWELGALWMMVGAPFLALSTLSPTAQAWFSRTEHPRAHDPFFLYAASNVGSFLGLLAYPLLIEPNLDLIRQANAFRWGYAVLVLATAASAMLSHRHRSPVPLEPQAKTSIGQRRRVLWVAASAVPSLMLLAVSRQIATDVASFPLLWVVPLAIYLGTFVLAFSSRSSRITAGAARMFPILAIPAAVAAAGVHANIWLGIGLPLLLLAASGLLSHGRLYASRPDAGRVTEFYVWVSVGGAVGGLLGALVAPVIFDRIAEYPIAIAATALFLGGQLSEGKRTLRIVQGVVYGSALVAAIVVDEVTMVALMLGLAGLAAYALAARSAWLALFLAGVFGTGLLYSDGELIEQERTFFGVYRVIEDSGYHAMISGTTVHGVQRFRPSPQLTPLAYYVPDGPFGKVMTRIGSKTDEIGVIGLGAGALSSYLDEGQNLTFYEIDPAVVNLATDPRLFTFTADTAGSVRFVVGDGRLALEEPHEPFGLLIIDAFSSDAIPTHLLTVEAVDAYLKAIEENGIIGFHISNRHLDLEPVIGRIAAEMGLAAVVNRSGPDDPQGSSVTFVAMARDGTDLSALTVDGSWRRPRVGPELWTDSFSDLLGVIRWN